MNARAVAQEATTWYQKHVDPQVTQARNVELYLKNIVLALTLRVLKDSPKEQGDWSKWNQRAYESLGRRDRARMDGFLLGCALAVPDDPCASTARSSPSNVPSKKTVTPSAGQQPKSNQAHKQGHMMRQNSPMLTSIQDAVRSRKVMEYPQLRPAEMTLRLELYVRTLIRIVANDEDQPCVLRLEPAKALKARAMCIVRAHVATVGCVTSMGPNLTRLLEALTRELLAVDTLCGEVVTVIRRVVSEYVHAVSFASLAFLSSPDDAAEQRLAPLVVSYLQYIQRNWERIVEDCEMERLLSTVIDRRMRHLFKTIEFRSIGHLLEVCEGFSYELQTIEVPPGMGRDSPIGGGSGDDVVVKQAIRDLQREVLTVNGHVLPPVQSRKELIQLLAQTLNSRSIMKQPRKKSDRRIKSCPSLMQQGIMSESSDGGIVSSGNEGDVDGSESKPPPPGMRRSRRRSTFHLSTVDVMTRRLLVASSRTGLGGDAYFIVRDLFGDEDVEVVPSTAQVPYGRPRSGSIEIVVRLSTITIKCHGSFDVYPKSLVGDCEPLIQLHTTTTETINLQEVRECDSDDNSGPTKSTIADDDSSDGGMSKLVLQERRTDRTGWRMVAIRPALYEKVGEWNTPS